nr:hypothetical protein [Tanacetum cinerariifolium]
MLSTTKGMQDSMDKKFSHMSLTLDILGKLNRIAIRITKDTIWDVLKFTNTRKGMYEFESFVKDKKIARNYRHETVTAAQIPDILLACANPNAESVTVYMSRFLSTVSAKLLEPPQEGKLVEVRFESKGADETESGLLIRTGRNERSSDNNDGSDGYISDHGDSSNTVIASDDGLATRAIVVPTSGILPRSAEIPNGMKITKASTLGHLVESSTRVQTKTLLLEVSFIVPVPATTTPSTTLPSMPQSSLVPDFTSHFMTEMLINHLNQKVTGLQNTVDSLHEQNDSTIAKMSNRVRKLSKDVVDLRSGCKTVTRNIKCTHDDPDDDNHEGEKKGNVRGFREVDAPTRHLQKAILWVCADEVVLRLDEEDKPCIWFCGSLRIVFIQLEYVKHKYRKYNFMKDNSWSQIIFEDIYNTFFKDEAEAEEEAKLAKGTKKASFDLVDALDFQNRIKKLVEDFNMLVKT